MTNEQKMESENSYESIRALLVANKDIQNLHIPSRLIIKYGLNLKEGAKWIDAIDEVEDKFYKEMRGDIVSILEQRKSLEWDTREVPEMYLEEAKQCIDTMNRSWFDPSSFVGKGAAGVIFLQNEEFDLCIKYLHDPKKSKNPIYKEFELLDKASNIGFKKLRVPQAHFLVSNRNPEKSIYSMDHIVGSNIEELVNTPEVFLKLINNDKERLLSIIKNIETNIHQYVEDIKMLHKNNIIHADFHIRNVLIGITGEMYLIDFGNSIDANHPTHEYVNDAKLYESLENIKEQDIDSIKNIVDITLKKLKEIYESKI